MHVFRTQYCWMWPYGQALYRSLAEVDKWGVDEIWLERPPQGEAWLAVHDRLRRAAS